jgi:dynein heavy chain
VLNSERANRLVVVKPTDRKVLNHLEGAIRDGLPLLLASVGQTLDAFLEPVLLTQTFKSAGTLCIKLGDNIVEYDPAFRLYITTKLPNPHYLPEVSVKVGGRLSLTRPPRVHAPRTALMRTAHVQRCKSRIVA